MVPVNKSSETYKMDHLNRGYAYIFHHENFDYNLELDPRLEDKVFVLKLTEALTNLNFNVKCFSDYTYLQIKEETQSCQYN